MYSIAWMQRHSTREKSTTPTIVFRRAPASAKSLRQLDLDFNMGLCIQRYCDSSDSNGEISMNQTMHNLLRKHDVEIHAHFAFYPDSSPCDADGLDTKVPLLQSCGTVIAPVCFLNLGYDGMRPAVDGQASPNRPAVRSRVFRGRGEKQNF